MDAKDVEICKKMLDLLKDAKGLEKLDQIFKIGLTKGNDEDVEKEETQEKNTN